MKKQSKRCYDCSMANFLKGGVWRASVAKVSSGSTFRLTPASLDGDNDGDLDGECVALITGGVERDETTSGVDARLPVPNSDLSRMTRLFAEVMASAWHVAW
jgi:hypothetical protein